MRFTKSGILESFERQDRSYRLAIMCSHWLRDTAPFKPNAVTEAKGLCMKINSHHISYMDLAEMLEHPVSREVITSDFLLNQLHALIRAPFELLSDYCEDYDKRVAAPYLLKNLKKSVWYDYTRLIRNAISHNFCFDFNERDIQRMPIAWNDIRITADMNGQAITYHSLWHKPGYELFLEMRLFARALPEPIAVQV